MGADNLTLGRLVEPMIKKDTPSRRHAFDPAKTWVFPNSKGPRIFAVEREGRLEYRMLAGDKVDPDFNIATQTVIEAVLVRDSGGIEIVGLKRDPELDLPDFGWAFLATDPVVETAPGEFLVGTPRDGDKNG